VKENSIDTPNRVTLRATGFSSCPPLKTGFGGDGEGVQSEIQHEVMG
jgi:hypothetical protein